MNRHLPLAIALFLAGPASAHGDTTAPDWPVLSVGALALLGLPYALGTIRVWTRAGLGRGIPAWRAACCGLGLVVLAAASLSPLHGWGQTLFAAHMIEHELLIAVAAPLIALGGPFPAAAWALPPPSRHTFGVLARPFAAPRLDAATAAHGLALWAWHLPGLYALALTSTLFHWLQHASLFLTALVFWQGMLGSRGRAQAGLAVFCLFATALHSGFLGILLTFASGPLYPGQGAAAADWGLTPLEDQQLAGLVMWVPGGLVYAGAALALVALWVAGSSVRIPSCRIEDGHAL
jgi:putative membrane protein